MKKNLNQNINFQQSLKVLKIDELMTGGYSPANEVSKASALSYGKSELYQSYYG